MSPGIISPPPELMGQDFFVEATVDELSPFVGQQLIYTFRFYQAIQLYRQPQYKMPSFNELETFGLPVQEYNIDVGGRTYLISEIRTALFPKSTGTIKIGPAQLLFPGSFFDEPVELYTEPVTLEVRPLPPNAPSGFQGAVGQFTIEARFSPRVAVINQPSTYSVVISGAGNLYQLPEPIWPLLSGWNAYDSLSSLAAEMKEGRVAGTRVFERVIISQRVGNLTIPQAKMVYFDPIAVEYRTISSESIPVRVIPAPTPDPAQPTVMAARPVATAVPAEQPKVNPVFSDLLQPGWRTMLPVGLVLFWAICGAIPVAAAVGAGGVWLWQKRKERQSVSPESLQLPRQAMHPALAAALKANTNNYRAVSQALSNHIGKCLNRSIKGLTRAEIIDHLLQHGVSHELVNRIKACLANSDVGLYGPDPNEPGWDLVALAETLLYELDDELVPALVLGSSKSSKH